MIVNNPIDELAKLIDWREFKRSLKELDSPKDKVTAYLKLLEFVVPKKQAIASDINVKQEDEAMKRVKAMCLAVGEDAE